MMLALPFAFALVCITSTTHSFVIHDNQIRAKNVVVFMGKGLNKARNKQGELARRLELAKQQREDSVPDEQKAMLSDEEMKIGVLPLQLAMILNPVATSRKSKKKKRSIWRVPVSIDVLREMLPLLHPLRNSSPSNRKMFSGARVPLDWFPGCERTKCGGRNTWQLFATLVQSPQNFEVQSSNWQQASPLICWNA
jgi:hypothetical protein